MALFNWSENLSVGVASIDEQHKKLIGLINDLHDAMLKGKGRDVLESVMGGLISYTKEHFTYEEDIFSKFGYSNEAAHKTEHKSFVNKIIEMGEKYKSSKAFLSIEIMEFLKDWLSNHIMVSDKKYTDFMKSNGIN